MSNEVKTIAALYHCKKCGFTRRVEYNKKTTRDVYRALHTEIWREENGKRIPYGAWVTACGGGKPTEYGGDPLGLCPWCGESMGHGIIYGTYNSEVECDARCTGAHGHNCECSCGGKNHGMKWA